MGSLIKQIDQIIEEKSLLKHPFYEMWSDGKLELESLKGYSKEYYQLVKQVPQFMEPLVNDATPEMKDELIQNMKEEAPQKVRFVTVEADLAGQRIDNFLRTQLKGVPKSMIYRILRKGEVRVNKGRVKPEYKLQADDLIRIPPVRVSEGAPAPSPKLDKIASLESHILFEDDRILVINKPSGMAVHGGSGLSFGLIEKDMRL